MIESLHVENFQSLQHIDIELGRFTVLVGPSNSGKSAIRRAVEALVRNDPPAGRLRKGCPGYVVSVELDGTFAAIHKTTKSTSYQAGELLIDKPGSTCPEAVANLLRLSETNFASQFDLPYLLAETPSAVARSLGELTNISVLFEGIREATRRQREASKRGKVFVEQVDVLADKLAAYEDLAREKTRLDFAQIALTDAAAAVNRDQALFAADAAAVQYQAQLLAETEALAHQPDWDYLEGTAAAIETTMGEAAMMDGACIRAGDLIQQRVLADAELYEIVTPDFDFETMEALIAQASTLHQAWYGRGGAKDLEALANSLARQVEPTAEEAQAEIELVAETICPLCELPLVRS